MLAQCVLLCSVATKVHPMQFAASVKLREAVLVVARDLNTILRCVVNSILQVCCFC
jgi:hypothetical protein